MQRAAIARCADARGDIISCWYSESRSGATLDRPELDRVRARARAGELGRLYVFRLDRLTRSGIRDTLEVVAELRRGGCDLVSVSDAFDVGGPAGDVVLAVMSWAAEMERRAIGERIAAARDRVEARGGTWGRPRKLGPYLLGRALALQAEGRSVRSISMALKIPRSTVQAALARTSRSQPSRKPPETLDADAAKNAGKFSGHVPLSR